MVDGGSCWAMTQRLTALIAAVPLMPMPHRLIRPPVATSAKPTIRALELVELIWMRVIDDCVLINFPPMLAVRCWLGGRPPGPRLVLQPSRPAGPLKSPLAGDVRRPRRRDDQPGAGQPAGPSIEETRLSSNRGNTEVEELRSAISDLKSQLAEARGQAEEQTRRPGEAAGPSTGQFGTDRRPGHSMPIHASC